MRDGNTKKQKEMLETKSTVTNEDCSLTNHLTQHNWGKSCELEDMSIKLSKLKKKKRMKTLNRISKNVGHYKMCNTHI